MIPKFRVWYHKHEAMYRVVNIYLELECITVLEDEYVFDFEDIALMQYTGLKDRNGSDVYFNDIVEDEYGHRYEVVFEGDCLRCNGVRKIRGGHKPKNRWFGRGLKIIGNIYENPELLEVAE